MAQAASLGDMVLFVEVARAASFTRASTRLGVPSATLSRRIAAMERRLGVRLFNRTTRRVEMTDAARRYLERCEHLVDEARLAETALRDTAERPSGHLRVSMPVDLGMHWVGPLLPEFARAHPGIRFDIDLSARFADLMGEQVDVALRLGPVKGDRLVVRRVGAVKQALYAATSYLDRRGRPEQPADLLDHECLHLGTVASPAPWRLKNSTQTVDVAVRGRFGLNNIGLMRLLAERGMGVAMLSPVLVRESVAQGRLEPVLPGFAAPPLPLHAVTFSHLQPAAVRAFVQFIAQRLALE
jgi:DNA-binding transcriptional LysR family regulator